jgi:hypothetical protein
MELNFFLKKIPMVTFQILNVTNGAENIKKKKKKKKKKNPMVTFQI